MPFRACALSIFTTGFALRNVHTHILMQIRIEICVCILLNANPVVDVLRARALKGTFNFTVGVSFKFYFIPYEMIVL